MEEWKSITNYDNLYLISNKGKVMSLNAYGHNKRKIISQQKDKNGYLNVTLQKNGKRKNMLVHRLVAMEFLENNNNYKEVNHIDGNKQNNKVKNLEWCDRKYNILKAFDNGLIKTRKPVCQYDLEGNLIAIWVSSNMAENVLKLNSRHVAECCKGKHKTVAGYIWRYKDV